MMMIICKYYWTLSKYSSKSKLELELVKNKYRPRDQVNLSIQTFMKSTEAIKHITECHRMSHCTQKYNDNQHCGCSLLFLRPKPKQRMAFQKAEFAGRLWPEENTRPGVCRCGVGLHRKPFSTETRTSLPSWLWVHLYGFQGCGCLQQKHIFLSLFCRYSLLIQYYFPLYHVYSQWTW